MTDSVSLHREPRHQLQQGVKCVVFPHKGHAVLHTVWVTWHVIGSVWVFGAALTLLHSLRLQLSEEEKQHLERFFTHDGESRRLEYLNSRRKSKKTYEYEVKWYGLRDSKNTWITREQCVSHPSTPALS